MTTADQIPEGLGVETIYIVEISYTPEAATRRPAVRLEHLGRIGRLLTEGRIVEAGGYLDFSTAILWVRASSEAEAVALVRDDIYVREGVWLDDARARPFGRVVVGEQSTDRAGDASG
jgi:uncharacterized protein YciI